MFVYYDNHGVLKEIVNDEQIRQGNSNIDYVYFFIEGADPAIVNSIHKALTFSAGRRTFYDEEGNVCGVQDEAFAINTHVKEIPFDKKRELKYFKYFENYEFFRIKVPDDVLNESGTVGLKIQMVPSLGSILTLGLLVFNVQITGGKAIIDSDTAITIAQWNYLVSQMVNIDDLDAKQDVLVSGVNIKTVCNQSIVGAGNVNAVWGYVDGNIVDQSDLQAEFNTKQDTLVSGVNIKTVNFQSLLGSGNIIVAAEHIYWGNIIGTLSNQTDLKNALDAKEDVANKVTSVDYDSTDNQYPSAKCVYDNIQNVMEVANGKCKAFVLSDKFTKIDNGVLYYTDGGVEQTMVPDVFYIYNSTTGEWEDKHEQLANGDYDDIAIVNRSFDSQNDSISPGLENRYIIFGDAPGGMAYYLLCVNNVDIETALSTFSINIGDVFIVIETNVPDRWYSRGYFYRLETANLGAFVTLSTVQTITGAKTFTGNTTFSYINGKLFPTYPVDLKHYNLVLNTSGNLEWENNVVTVSSLAEMASNITYAKVIAPLFQGKNIELVIDAGLFLPDQQPIGTYIKLHPTQIDEVNKFIVYSGTLLNAGQYDMVPILGYLGLNYDSVNQAITDMTPVLNTPYDVEEAQIYISNFVDNYDAGTILPRFYNPSTTDSGTVIRYDSMLIFNKSANTTFTLLTPPDYHTPEYKAIITNTANSSIVLTFTGVSKIITNDEDNVVVSSNTITLAAGVTIEISIMNNNMVAINFNA